MYRGVVEDNNDPAMLGRCRIRVWGIHGIQKSGENEGIPTRGLPWAEPALGLLEGSQSGLGAFAVPLNGSHVFLFFEGGYWESPIYFATVPGKPESVADPSLGFNDPNGTYPLEEYVGESDFPRIARGVIEGTIHATKHSNLVAGIEPDSDFYTVVVTEEEPEKVYPNNIVTATRSGHAFELDNTPDYERVHIYHKANTYIEMGADGRLVTHIEGNQYNITKSDSLVYISGQNTATIIGSHTMTAADMDISSNSGDINITAAGNLNLKAGGTVWIEGLNVVIRGNPIALN